MPYEITLFESLLPYLIVLSTLALLFGLLGRWVAIQCRRSDLEGFLLGFLFGPLGVVIEALLPRRLP